jgi:hypothetical protein
MLWKKKGLIYCSDGEYEWNKSHSQVPVAIPISENLIRVFFGARNARGKSQIGFVDISAHRLGEVVNVSANPVLTFGDLGTFDEAGVVPSCLVKHESALFLYYIGYTVRNTIPYHNSIGLAISTDEGLSFQRFSKGPLFESNIIEPYFSASCYVMEEVNKWKMWYLSCTGWKLINGAPEPFYNIKYAESIDGIHWIREGIVCIENTSNSDAIAKPSVIYEGGIYKMWYSYRKALYYKFQKKSSYRIGYAESHDGKKWNRKDNLVGIKRSIKGWDSEMMEYCHILDIHQRRIMFYNGNGFGKTGFGYAVLEE